MLDRIEPAVDKLVSHIEETIEDGSFTEPVPTTQNRTSFSDLLMQTHESHGHNKHDSSHHGDHDDHDSGHHGDDEVIQEATNETDDFVSPPVNSNTIRCMDRLITNNYLGSSSSLTSYDLLTFSRCNNDQGTIYLYSNCFTGSTNCYFPLWGKVQNSSEGPYSTLAGAFGIDGFSLFVTMLITIIVIIVSLLSTFLERENVNGPEPYVLLLLAATGGMIMAGANDFIILFLGIEVLSISSYVLVAMNSKRIQSQEAGLKYFILGAFASGFYSTE